MRLEFRSTDEARALLRTITAAKFSDPPYDTDILTSRLVVRIADEVSRIVKEEDERQWGEIGKQNWMTWYWLSPERREWKIALKHGVSLCGSKWKGFSQERRAEIVNLLLCPFGLTDEFLTRFMYELDQLCIRKRS